MYRWALNAYLQKRFLGRRRGLSKRFRLVFWPISAEDELIGKPLRLLRRAVSCLELSLEVPSRELPARQRGGELRQGSDREAALHVPHAGGCGIGTCAGGAREGWQVRAAAACSLSG